MTILLSGLWCKAHALRRSTCLPDGITYDAATGELSVDSATGRTVFSFKTLKDAAVTNRVAMSFASKTGKMKLVLSATDLAGVPAGEAHLGIEITIGSQVYITHVTFFETSPGKYGLAIP